MAQKYGVTFWGNYFLEAINKFHRYDARIGRGKTYANTGRVHSIKIDYCKVKAKVIGSYGYDYNVALEFEPFNEKEKKTVIQVIDTNPMYIGEILNGTLPENLLNDLENHDISLFPKKWEKLKRRCSCPDWGDPCKHMAGLYFILTQEIDKDPFLLFSFRGIDLVKHYKINSMLKIDYPVSITYTDETKTKIESDQSGNDEINILKFESFKEFILQKLEDNPTFFYGNFKNILDKFYKQSSKMYPTVLLSNIEDDTAKLETLFQSVDIYFEARPNIYTSFFYIKDSLVNEENIKKTLKKYGKYVKSTFTISPLNICKLFLNFKSYAGSPVYQYLYWLSRAAYTLIESGAFIPAVMNKKGSFFCVYRLLSSPLQIQKQLSMLNEVTPVFVKFNKDKKYFDRESTNRFLLSSIFTEYVHNLSFKPKALLSRFNEYLLEAVFQGIPFETTDFETKRFPNSVDNYFSVFKLIESNINFTLIIDEDHDSYTFRLKANDFYINEIQDKDNKVEIARLLVNFSDILPEVQELFDKKEIIVSGKRLENFILKQKNLISDLGINIALPKELKKLLKPEMKLKATSKASSFKSFLNLNKLLEYDVKIAIGDEEISPEELEKLISEGRELVKFKDKFVILNPDEVNKLLKDARKQKKLTKFELLRETLTDNIQLDKNIEDFIKDLFRTKDFPLPEINASLRNYQLTGFKWAVSNLLNGFGALLADDMGLGKTLQTLAVLKYLKDNKYLKHKSLVVVPATLLNNWENEILKFTPDLTYHFYYGANRHIDNKDIIITTYQTLRRDFEKLANEKLSALVIDEAQYIKNPSSQTANAVKSIKADYKIALSGTPVENNLTELWSIFDFTIPGYLMKLKDFQNSYAKPVEIYKDKEKANQLKSITSPFLLRRLKTDKTIIQDLPEKIITDQLIDMKKEQASLYQAVVDNIITNLSNSDKQSRQGEIFKLLISLKQICNHPRNYDKKSEMSKNLSGKCEVLFDLLDTIISNDEKVLIFTQFVEMGNILKEIIKNELFTTPLFLEGSQSQNQRKKILNQFQDDPKSKVFILSLKAGGTGLNLTQANNVIMYDLWFNPAVENQAIDRAFRIGQEKNVNVYRFITKNSFEEKINKMINAKKELTELTVSKGENWLNDLSDDELKNIFSREN